mmetsp:Transcript_118102/g.333968  ORF Transcript_118102/g.333968 Transcript_118102/m.333968 type:complete len:168 (-) Transcript_118102:194-697(-)
MSSCISLAICRGHGLNGVLMVMTLPGVDNDPFPGVDNDGGVGGTPRNPLVQPPKQEPQPPAPAALHPERLLGPLGDEPMYKGGELEKSGGGTTPLATGVVAKPADNGLAMKDGRGSNDEAAALAAPLPLLNGGEVMSGNSGGDVAVAHGGNGTDGGDRTCVGVAVSQ